MDPTRDGVLTEWITAIAMKLPSILLQDAFWSFTRIFVFFLPLFLALTIARGKSLFRGIGACAGYGSIWVACYGLVKPLWALMGWPVTPDCFTAAAEWASCIGLAAMLAI